MKNIVRILACVLGIATALPATAAPLKEIFSLGGGGLFAQDHIWRIDLSTSTVTDLGSSGVNFPTNLAMAPDRTLYYMNPFEAHSLYKATLNGTNTALVGAPTLVKALPTAGFGIIDGMTVGPDGNLYMTGYGKSEIYRYDPVADVFAIAVVLSGGGQFRSDLAFDPITGNLVGLGIEPGVIDGDRTLFEIPALTVLTPGPITGNPYTWSYFGGASSAWSTKTLNDGLELGGNPDGLAFDPTNGDLYMSGDGTGIYSYGRVTAIRGALIAGTGDGALNGLGFDLAFQTRAAPIGVPSPGTLWLLLVGLGAMAMRQRAIRR